MTTLAVSVAQRVELYHISPDDIKAPCSEDHVTNLPRVKTEGLRACGTHHVARIQAVDI